MSKKKKYKIIGFLVFLGDRWNDFGLITGYYSYSVYLLETTERKGINDKVKERRGSF